MRAIRRIIVHHSASPRSVTTEQIRHWHIDGNGWSDIGYHGVIEGDGTFVPGRPLDKTGAHARGANRDSIGICVVGDNTHPDRGWTENQVLRLRLVIESLRLWWPEARVMGHRDVAETLCPGLDLRDVIPDLLEPVVVET